MIFKQKPIPQLKIITFLFFVIFITLTNQQCLTYEYLDPNNNTCVPCGYPCKKCFDSNTCTSCSKQFYLDVTSNKCEKCPFGCQSCTNSSNCITCNQGLYIDSKGDCLPCSKGVSSCSIAVVQQCHDGYFLLGGICAECLNNCKTCQDFVTCTECVSGYYLSSDQQSCLNCGLNCQICTDSTSCSACKKGYSLNGGICVADDCSAYKFCSECNVASCLSCEKSKYLDMNGNCIQGASILCAQSSGIYYTNCDVIDYGCAQYAQVQYDQFQQYQQPACYPLSASQYEEYIYGQNNQSNCVSSTCGSQFSQILEISTRKSYYKVDYHLNIKFYKNPEQSLKMAAINSLTQQQQASNIHNLNITLELTTFAQQENNCPSCPYGQVYLTGTLQSNGYQQSIFNLSDQNGAFTVVQYIFKFSICTVQNCQTCTTVSDCILCLQPYYLQLIKCVSQCDAGFYQYQRYCLLECPQNTFAIQSSYQCQQCVSPCQRCVSQKQCVSCVEGYFLQGSKCVLNCSSSEYFGNITTRECEACPNPCETCVSVNSSYVKCSSCMLGYLYLQQKCIFVCPLSYYGSFSNEISQCSVCDSSCSQCYMSSNTCNGCTNGFLLYGNYCNQTIYCQSGYFISINNTCKACQFPCATCNSQSTNCTSCLKGGLYQNKCYSQCPSGYFMDISTIQNITCQQCVNNCFSCLSQNLCLSCLDGFYLYGTECHPTCTNQSFYANPANNTCTLCPAPCKQCTSPTNCLSCSTGYLDGSKCTLKCNQSSYINSNFECTLCPSPCIECYSQTQCIKCQLPYILNSTQCITTTQCQTLGKYVSYVKDSTNTYNLYGQCKQCTFPCSTCQTSSILCSSCVSNYLYLPDLKTCQQQCPLTYYQTQTQCLKCSSTCYLCSLSPNNCTSCSTGTYLDILTNSCVTPCPDGYYADNQMSKCLKCVSPCNTCYNVYFCKSCDVGIYYNKVCVSACPSGTILNTTANECVMCTNNCLTCSIVPSNCTSCVSGYYFNSNSNTCTLTCNDGYYADTYTQGCQQCVSPCEKCVSSTSCISCVANYFLQGGKNCVLSCPNQYYANFTSLRCQICNLTICMTCNQTSNDCLSCANGYFWDLVSNSCVLSCPSGYYSQEISRSCKSCQFPCSKCSNISYCTQCESNYKLFLNRCYSQCPVGYFGTNVCEKCGINCQICTSLSNCSKCANNYYVQNGVCVSECSSGLYKAKQEITNYDYCVSCPVNCLKCSDYTTCLQCTTNYFLFNGLCLSECPILHYQDISSLSCKVCPQNCIKCVNSSYCLQCVNSYIYNNTCLEQCPPKTYIFNQKSCQSCVEPCNECVSQFQCLTCINSYMYYDGYCVKSCPSGVWYYPHNKSCGATCPYNKYQEEMICYIQGCGGKLVELNNYCLKNCPLEYYVSQQQSCIACTQNTQICKDLFVADLQVLRSQQLTLVLYYSQEGQVIGSIEEVNVTFVDENSKVINLKLLSYEFNSYSIMLKYEYESVEFLTVYMTIPYINSLSTAQAISSCQYSSVIYYFNNYGSDKQSSIYSISTFIFILGSVIAMLICIGLLIAIVINLISKTSHFLQLLDLIQIVAASIYLDIQYPQFLENFLSSLSLTLFTFMPQLLDTHPYTFSSPKYIFHNTDTSLTRTHLLTFIIFIVLLILMATIIIIHKYFKPLPIIVNRIKYRNLNDLFSIFSFPLLLFAFPLTHAKTIDILVAIVIIIITSAWIIFISNLIIQAKQMGDLLGLLSDYEAVSSKLGLMYAPFSYIRRLIIALVFSLFPDKPLAALTLVLIFTILILICLYFYQPFASQITDYVSMYMQFSLIIYIILIVIIGLDILSQEPNRVTATIAIILMCLAMAVGLGWLCYLTFGGLKNYIQNFNKLDEKDTQNCIKQDKKQDLQNKEDSLKHNQHEAEYSATNLMNPNRQIGRNIIIEQSIENDVHSHSNKEEFKHWNDEEESVSHQADRDNELKANNRLPEMLMKKKIQQNQKQNHQSELKYQ